MVLAMTVAMVPQEMGNILREAVEALLRSYIQGEGYNYYFSIRILIFV